MKAPKRKPQKVEINLLTVDLLLTSKSIGSRILITGSEAYGMTSEELQKKIAENIVKYRDLNNISQVELAQMLDYSNKSVSKWERGLGTPDILVLYRLSVIFGISVSELIGQDEMSKETKELIKKTEKDKKEQRKAKNRAEERAKKQKKKEHK